MLNTLDGEVLERTCNREFSDEFSAALKLELGLDCETMGGYALRLTIVGNACAGGGHMFGPARFRQSGRGERAIVAIGQDVWTMEST